jgi:hypothetical protein
MSRTSSLLRLGWLAALTRVAGCFAIAISLALTGCGQHGDAGLRAGADAAKTAADRLVAMSPPPPRQSDPAAAPLLDSVFNIAAFPNTPLSVDDIDAIVTWSLSASRVGNLYVYDGTAVPSDPANPDSNTVLRAQKNIVTFAPEVGRYFDTLIQLFGMADKLFLQARKDPEKYGIDKSKGYGIGNVASGTTALFVKVLNAMTYPGIDDNWRNSRIGILNGAAQDASALLSAQQRSMVQEAAQAAENAASNPDVKNGLVRLYNWFSPDNKKGAETLGGFRPA